MRSNKTFIKGAFFVIALAISAVTSATDLTRNELLSVIGQGLTIAEGGTGLQGRSGAITVEIGGPVVSATLVWVGRDRPCTRDGAGDCIITGADDELLFNGILIPNDRLIGEEDQFDASKGDANNIGYAADVTSIVAAAGMGTQVFTVEDGDAENLYRLNGAGLLVIYADPSMSGLYEIIVYDGLDFAYFREPEGTTERVTEPVQFMFEVTEADRTGEVLVFVGDAEPDRPDRVAIDSPDAAVDYLNDLDGSDGASFDTDAFPVLIPAASSSLTVQLFSEPNAFMGGNPDSLMWALTTLRIPQESDIPEGTGRMTGGRNVRVDGAKVSGVTGGMTIHCDVTLSNNLQVSWPANKWHLDKETLDNIMCLDHPDIVQAPPEAPLDTFIGTATGKLNGEPGSAIRFRFVDAGEPGRNDYIEIAIWSPGDDPTSDTPYFSVAGNLDGGNIQAHFDQPHSN